jgi:hypothetical protein
MKSALFLSVVCASLLLALPAQAQTPSRDEDVQPYEEIIGRQVYFDPAKFGMSKIETPDRFYDLLTRPERCPPGEPLAKTKRKTACAFISYAPPGTNEAAYTKSLRPVFRVVSPDEIWTILDSGLARVSVKKLESVRDLKDPNDPARNRPYTPVAVVGASENEAACRARRKCVDTKFFRALIDDVGILTDGCVAEIWDSKGGASGAGEQSRCRYRTDRDFPD